MSQWPQSLSMLGAWFERSAHFCTHLNSSKWQVASAKQKAKPASKPSVKEEANVRYERVAHSLLNEGRLDFARVHPPSQRPMLARSRLFQ